MTSTFCGSMTYTSPEVIRGEKYTELVDVWALGVLLYAIANCQLPWEDENQKKLCQKSLYFRAKISSITFTFFDRFTLKNV